MSATVSVRLATATCSRHAGQRKHDLREGIIPQYVEPTRSERNQVVLEPPTPANMADEAHRRRKARYERGELERRPGSPRRDAAVAIHGIITFGSDGQPAIEALDPDDQTRRYQAAAQAAADELGTDVAGLVIHRDESAAHAHFTLHGYAPDGRPVAKKMTKGRLSQIQDAGAQPYQDLGLRRGKPIGVRIAAGEDYATTVHRTVAQLHRDLPAELDAAQQRAAEAQAEAERQERRLEATQQKLATAESESAKLAKRIENDERRLKDAQKRAETAEAEHQRLEATIAQLAHEDPDPPERHYMTIPQTEQRGRLRPQQVVTGERQMAFMEPTEVDTWRGQVRRRIERLEAQAAEAESLQQALLDDTVATAPVDAPEAARWAARAPLEQRYSVSMQIGDQLARVPPQGASPRQAAAALYRHARDAGWETQCYHVPDAVAERVLAMAAQDGRLACISFRDARQAQHLEQARHHASLDDDPSATDDPSDDLDGPRM